MNLSRNIFGIRCRATSPVVLWLVWFAGSLPAVAQVGQGHPVIPPVGMPGGMVPAPPAAAVIDTAVVVLEIVPESSLPVLAHTVPDTVPFGGQVHLVLDYSPSPQEDLAIAPMIGADWLAPVPPKNPGLVDRILGKNPGPQLDLSDLPELGEKVRAVHSFQVFRTNPFRLQVGTYLSSVIHVQGRIEDTQQTAAIRAPRAVGWSPLVILILLVVLALILLIARWLWNRGSRSDELLDRPLPAPAWLAAAIELRDLLQGGFLQRGDDRAFLDGLAGIVRRFVAGRYRIAAQDMTGREIMAACAKLGHLSGQPGVFARLIDATDRHRYDPEGSEVSWSREQAVRFFDHLAEARIMPRFTEVPAPLKREADLAWAGLERELSSGPSRLKNARAAIPEPRT